MPGRHVAPPGEGEAALKFKGESLGVALQAPVWDQIPEKLKINVREHLELNWVCFPWWWAYSKEIEGISFLCGEGAVRASSASRLCFLDLGRSSGVSPKSVVTGAVRSDRLRVRSCWTRGTSGLHLALGGCCSCRSTHADLLRNQRKPRMR